jgi:hypothetical protein
MKWIKNLVRKSEGKDSFENLCIDGRIILRWILNKYCMKVWTGYIWLRIGSKAWSYEPVMNIMFFKTCHFLTV